MPGYERSAEPSPPPAVASTSWLRWALAALWLLDAGLQLQPSMFGQGFSGNVIYNSALMYQPPGLENFLFAVARLEAHHLVLLSAGIATVEAAIGLGLLWRPTRRAAIVTSIAWAALVWVLGQGLGFMATGTAMVEFGAPGSAVLYIVVALVVWADESGPRARGPGTAIARIAWSGYWGLGALLHIPWHYSPAAVLAYNLQTAAQLQPAHLSGLDYTLARAAYLNSAPVSIILASLELLLAVGVWMPVTRRWSVALGLGLTAVFWVLGQAMGGILTGLATDPGTAPLVALLGIRLLTSRPWEAAVSSSRLANPAPSAPARSAHPTSP